MSETRVIRADSAERDVLERAGWHVVALSWAAPLDAADADQQRLRSAIEMVAGFAIVRELVESDIEQALSLDARTAADYPGGIATQHQPLSRTEARRTDRRRGYGAFGSDGRLLAMSYVDVDTDGCAAETSFTVVDAGARRRGLATAVKAASVLSLLSDGILRFRTGGSAENTAIIAANSRLGYLRDEEWATMKR
jgi:hypothetical protein